MKNVWTLLKVQLLNFFGINKILHSNDKKAKRKAVGFFALMVFAFAYMAVLVFLMCFGMGKALLQLGALEHLPTLVMAMTTIMILMTTIYKVNGTLFGFKDYDTIMSLPVKTGEIVASRLLVIYSFNLFFSMAIMLPAGVAYVILAKPSALFYPIYLLLMLAVPLIPIIVASVIGTVISMISSRFKHSGTVNLIVSLVFFVGIMVVSFSFGAVTGGGGASGADFANVGQMIGTMTDKIYPLAGLFTAAIYDLNIVALLIFLGVSAALFLGFSYLVGVMFKWLNTGAMTTRASANYKLQEMKVSSPFMALYKKELKRFFSSSLYVLNCGVGCLMLIIMAVAVVVFGSEAVAQVMGIPGIVTVIAHYSPLLFAFLMVMSSTTAASISLEGKNLWVTKSLPVSERTVFNSKIAVNLTILLPSILISGLMVILGFKFNPLSAALLILLPAAYAFYIALLGLIVNLQHPHMDWINEGTVIKQSSAIMLTLLFGMLSACVPIAGVIFIKAVSSDIILVATLALVIIADIGMYRYLLTKGAKLFRKL